MKYDMIHTIGKTLLLLPAAALMLFAGCEAEPLTAELPQEGGSPLTAGPSFVYPGEETEISHRWQGEDMTFELRRGKGMEGAVSAAFVQDAGILQEMTEKYADLKGMSLYTLLPQDKYSVPSTVTLPAGQEKVSVTVSIKADVEPGTFVLPLVLMSGEDELGVQYVEVVSHPDAEIDLSWLERTPSVTEPRFVAIIEAAENDMRNAGNYILYPEGIGSPETARPLFDMVVLFSANINFNEYRGCPELYFNDNIRKVLDNKEVFIRPLQDKGIKVLLSIMPNHQAIGFSNMDISGDRTMIKDFAQEVYDALQEYGLDGVMFDDEYADYPTSPESEQPGRPMVQMGSFHFFLKALRDLMPAVDGQAWKDRHNLITMYNIGPNSNARTGGGGWGLFSNNFEVITSELWNGSTTMWSESNLTADARALKKWVADEANAQVLEEISGIKAGELFDFIWNANYARGDAHNQATGIGTGYTYIAGLTDDLAKKKYGMAVFEMSLEVGDRGDIQHQQQYWGLSDYQSGTPGRNETIEATLNNQRQREYELVMCFNLQYVPDEWDGEANANLYLNDFPRFMKGLGYSGSPEVQFEGTNYDTFTPAYMR